MIGLIIFGFANSFFFSKYYSGSRSVEGKTVHTELVISSKERHYFDMVYNFTSMAGNSKLYIK